MGNLRSTLTLSDNYPLSLRVSDLSVSKLKLASAVCGSDCIDLASGTPGLGPPENLLKAAARAVSSSEPGYTSVFGDLELRTKIAEFYSSTYPREFNADKEVTITNGTSSAIAAVLFSIINPGDEVIVFEPFYESYKNAIQMAGGTPVFARLRADDWSLRLDKLEKAFSKKTRAVILNTPHNPTGQIFTLNEIRYIAELLEEHGAVLISDEIYSRLILDDNKHRSPLCVSDFDPSRVIVIDGMSKGFNVSDWRIGFIIASQAYTEAIRIVHSTLGLQAPAPLQIAAREAFRANNHCSSDSNLLQTNLDCLLSAILKAGFVAKRPKGANFIFADFQSLGNEKQDPRDLLLQKAGILAQSGSTFFASGKKAKRSKYLRLCFGREETVIAEAARRIESL